MNISKNKIQIISILTLVILIAILSLFKRESLIFTNGNIKEPIVTKEIKINNIPALTYVVKNNISGYDINKNDVTYEPVNIPQIVNTSNNQVWNKVNQSILDNFENNICAYTGDSITKSDIYYNWGATTTLLTKHVLSLNVSIGSDCGGAHPNVSTYGLNFNLDNWMEGKNNRQIDFTDIFKDYEKDKLKIKNIVLAEVMKGYDANMATECKTYIGSNYKSSLDYYKESGIEPFSYSFDDKGLYILSFGLPHAVANCEPTDTLISYTLLKDHISPEFLEMLK